MAVDFNKILNESIKKIIKENIEKQYNNFTIQWRKVITESNSMIDDIKNTNYDFNLHNEEISNMIEKLNITIDNYTEIISDKTVEKTTEISEEEILEIGRNLEGNYRKLSLVYYKYHFSENEKNNRELQDKYSSMLKMQQSILSENEKLVKQKEEFEEKFNQTNLKLESLGATFLNIVLTVSITSTMVAVLQKVSPKYSLAVVLGCAWLLLSSILFVGEYFKTENQKNMNKKISRPMIIYIILSIITLLSFSYGVFTDEDKKSKHDAIEKSESNKVLNKNNKSIKKIEANENNEQK